MKLKRDRKPILIPIKNAFILSGKRIFANELPTERKEKS